MADERELHRQSWLFAPHRKLLVKLVLLVFRFGVFLKACLLASATACQKTLVSAMVATVAELIWPDEHP